MSSRGVVVALSDRRRYPHRLAVNIDETQYRALRRATAEDDIAVAFRIRALIQHWIDDQAFRDSTNQVADHLRDQEARYRKTG